MEVFALFNHVRHDDIFDQFDGLSGIAKMLFITLRAETFAGRNFRETEKSRNFAILTFAILNS